jgi:2'-hydroxyisoflavone reductase
VRAVKLLVIGGTGFLGLHSVAQALERGHDVTTFNRGVTAPGLFPEAEHLIGDRDGGLAPLEGRRFDAVLDTCGYVPRVVSASATLLAGAADRYLFVSSLSAFPDDAPPGVTESHAAVDPAPEGVEEIGEETYGPLKVACEMAVERAMPGRALIVRPGFIVGPNDPTDRFTYWIRRAADGGRMLAPAPSDYVLQFVDVRDLAAFQLDMLERGETGLVHTVGPGEAATLGLLIEDARAAGPAELDVVWAEAEAIKEHTDVDLFEVFPLWIGDIAGFHAFDASKAVGLGLRYRPVAETVRDTLAWDRERPQTWPMKAGLAPDQEARLLQALSSSR